MAILINKMNQTLGVLLKNGDRVTIHAKQKMSVEKSQLESQDVANKLAAGFIAVVEGDASTKRPAAKEVKPESKKESTSEKNTENKVSKEKKGKDESSTTTESQKEDSKKSNWGSVDEE